MKYYDYRFFSLSLSIPRRDIIITVKGFSPLLLLLLLRVVSAVLSPHFRRHHRSNGRFSRVSDGTPPLPTHIALESQLAFRVDLRDFACMSPQLHAITVREDSPSMPIVLVPI